MQVLKFSKYLESVQDAQDEEQFMQQAIELAKENIRNGGGPFACLIVKGGKIVGKGANSVTKNNDPTAHAEVQAIRDACSNLGTFQLNGC